MSLIIVTAVVAFWVMAAAALALGIGRAIDLRDRRSPVRHSNLIEGGQHG